MTIVKRRRTLALLVDSISSDYVMLIRAAVERQATKRGVDILVVTGQRLAAPRKLEATQNRIFELVSSASVDGVLLLSTTLGHYCGVAGVARLCKRYGSLPLCSIGLEIEGIPSLIVNNLGGMDLGVSHLLDVHKCRNLAFIGGQKNSPESVDRLLGFRKAHTDRGLLVNEKLIEHAEFTLASGRVATEALLATGEPIDGVVAANDYMALAALEVLKKHGRDVPKHALVLGFDDASAASCARPALTTLKQPLRWLGANAVDLMLKQLDGETVPMCSKADLDLAVRESCGCAGRLPTTLNPGGGGPARISAILKDDARRLTTALIGLVKIPGDGLGDWPGRLLESLGAELEGETGAFAHFFEQLLADAHDEGADVEEFQHVLTVLRAELRNVDEQASPESRQFERVLHLARILITTAAIRYVGRELLEIEHSTPLLGRSGERFATSLSMPSLKQAILEELPELNVKRASVSLFERGADGRSNHQLLKTFLVLKGGKEAKASEETFDARLLGPDVAMIPEVCEHSVVFPLTFEDEFLGIGVCGGTAVPAVFGALRQQIGAAIQGARLHREIVEQVAMRERSERKQLAQEALLAADIQTSMVPTHFEAPGLDIAAMMAPAAEAGGDYYDIIPDESGALIGIGDVTGHGLGAGLIMLMLQSMISGMARLKPPPSPSDMIVSINRALYEGVRHRLGRDEHATLTLIRYDRDGTLRYSGAHEPLIIHRASSGQCEVIDSPGFWVGAVPDVAHMTSQESTTLHDGDLLILHTDGLTEPRNIHHEQFGLKRLTSLIRETAHLPVGQIRDRVVAGVRAWTTSFDDDISLVAIRYQKKP